MAAAQHPTITVQHPATPRSRARLWDTGLRHVRAAQNRWLPLVRLCQSIPLFCNGVTGSGAVAVPVLADPPPALAPLPGLPLATAGSSGGSVGAPPGTA